MRRAFVTHELPMVVALVFIIAAAMFPIFSRARENVRRSTCQANLKQIGLAFQQYVRDSDGYFPSRRVSAKQGWGVSIRPYLTGYSVFNCPTKTRTVKCGSQSQDGPALTDYFYNARFSKLAMKQVGDSKVTILAGDGNYGAPLDTAISSLPQSWRNYEESPAYLHKGGANYAFADGHVKWLKVEEITLKNPKQADVYTFVVH